MFERILDWLPFAIAVVLAVVGLRALDWILLRRRHLAAGARLPRQITLVVLSIVGVVIIILLIPTGEGHIVSDNAKGDLLSLLGLAIGALLTLSSTTLAANAMAGAMLRTVNSFRPGDFVRCGEYFGRVTERGLFHTEIQTEDRDLVTIPNLHLATHPVRVVRSSGTIISAEVSLGYDNPHAEIERLLIQAAERSGLTDPFVWVTDLRDHAVVYRISGFLSEIKTLISARSALRIAVLDSLHAAGVEIVSPGFIYQRRTDDDQRILATSSRIWRGRIENRPEEIVFDKADQAERAEQLKLERERLATRIDELKKTIHDAPEEERPPIQQELDAAQVELDRVDAEIAASAAEAEAAVAATGGR
ncbi:MAG: mechanosensitive ion channel domain-containing protein [Phycisphaerales bacterium JB039]